MMRRTLGLVLAAVAGLALTGCAVVAGPTDSEDRQVGDVQAVELSTSGDLVVVHGDRPALTVTAAKPALERLTSDVQDGRLVLSTDGAAFITGRIAYLLETDHLDDVVIRGSGDVTGSDVTADELSVLIQGSGNVTLDGLDAHRVTVRIEGSGDVTLSGTADELDVRVAGSGNAHTFDLEVAAVTAEVAGSGDIQTSVTDTLGARVAGSGNVVYRGDPKVSSQVLGSGDVRQD
jgi:hypothetical protein